MVLGANSIEIGIRAYDDFSEPADRISKKVKSMTEEIQKSSKGTLTYAQAQEKAVTQLSFFEKQAYSMGVSVKSAKMLIGGLAAAVGTLGVAYISLLASTKENQVALSLFKQNFSDFANNITKDAAKNLNDYIIVMNEATKKMNELTGTSNENNTSWITTKGTLGSLGMPLGAVTDSFMKLASEQIKAKDSSYQLAQAALANKDSLNVLKAAQTANNAELAIYNNEMTKLKGLREGEANLNKEASALNLKILEDKARELEINKLLFDPTLSKEKKDDLREEANLITERTAKNQEDLTIAQAHQAVKNAERTDVDATTVQQQVQSGWLNEISASHKTINMEARELVKQYADAGIKAGELSDETLKKNLIVAQEDANKKLDEFNDKWGETEEAVKEVARIINGMEFQVTGGGGGGGGDVDSAGDFMSRPGQDLLKFSPNDTIIGVKDPSKLGGGGSIINIQNLYASNPHDFAVEIQRELNRFVTT